MNFIKILLFALGASILFFVYLEVEKTDNSVMATQGYKPKGHTIYRDGKAIKISNKEYAKLKAIPSINKKVPIVHDIEASEIKTLQLSGLIPDGLNYTIKTFYESDSKGFICGKTRFSWGTISGGAGFYLTNSTKVATYSPTIKDGHHNIEIPLNEFDSTLGCNYHLNLIQMEMTNTNLTNNMSYGRYFKLFFPKEKYSRHVTPGSPYNHRVGKKINMECTSKNWSDKNSYFDPNCHLKSTLHTFFTAQSLNYSKYEFNINTNSEHEYKQNLFFKSKEYISRVTFVRRISSFPTFHEKKLNDFTQIIEKLDTYQNRVSNYFQETKEGLNSIIENNKERLTDEDIKLLERKLKRLEKSIQSHKKVMEIEKELLYDSNNIDELDTLSREIKIDKLFFINEFYKYEMLHLANLSIKNPNFLYHKLYSLRKAQSDVSESFSRFFLTCKKSNNFLYEKLKNITNAKKTTDTKKLLKQIRRLESLLFLKNQRNYYHLLQELDKFI